MENYYYKLTDICEFQGGSQPPKEQWTNHYKDGYIRMLQIRDFTQNRVDEEFVKITNTIKTCNKDDVLIARYGASIGKILTGLEGAYNVAIMKSIPNESILNKRYMYYYFNTQYFQHNIKNVGSRAAQAGFNKTELESMQIYAPSLETQKKIVEVLDKAQELIDKRKEQIKAMDELVKSRFIEMFGDPVINQKQWKTEELGKVCDVRDGTHDSPQYVSDGYPLITSKNISNGVINFEDVNFISKDDLEAINKRSKVDNGDIIMPMIGTIGNPVIVNTSKEFAIKNVALIKFNEKTLVRNIFIKSLLESHYFEVAISQNKRGGTQKFIALGDIRKLNVILPPIELQNEFADFVNQVDQLKSQMETSLKELEDNFNSLMQKAFKGELF